MEYERELLEALSNLPARAWDGTVFRHMFADLPPDRENTSGARWNPPQVPAIYASLARDGAIAEADFQIAQEPLRPVARRTVYSIEVRLASVLDLSAPGALASLGIDVATLEGVNHDACQRIGGAAERLGHDGMLVPSARSSTLNLVIFPNQHAPTFRFETVSAEVIADPAWGAGR